MSSWMKCMPAVQQREQHQQQEKHNNKVRFFILTMCP